ncbi:tryptophan halogenase family protein [Glaciecola sp. KUL10]|uniref:tryptophan halogenase family protein n=1 Tax=Glaciecola sp. (strain KUL10) TaxID=2161813 RepID=UPI000D786D2B|nr:tryptophan halogenase family protein [Glaciecola sp. KUL10]GBL05380.1 tryptophan halogenase [Glaciecola sp. KUL10]
MKKIVILGGGTAGWMAANILNKALAAEGFEIHLIESEQIGIIGVGEGSTPQLKQFFAYLDIDESQWMPACNATYKNGISFNDWTNSEGHNHYFHPFPSPFDQQTLGAFLYYCKLRHQGMDIDCLPNQFFLTAKLAEYAYTPITKEGIAPIKLNYAYHFDSVLLGQFLAKIAKEKGVKHTIATLKSSELDEPIGIKSISLDNGDIVEADLFVDASGFNSELLQKALGVKFHSYSDNLFNDSAIAFPSEITEKYNTQTEASALSAGWAWKIPLTNRYGNGYVFSSRYTDFEQAESELKAHLGIASELEVNARRLKMKVGQVEKHWHKNVLAIGLSQGFIEPLEATALHLVQESLMQFIKHFNKGKFIDENKTAFNQTINERFEGIRDYIVCHYKVNTRTDSQYWQDNRDNPCISENLQAVLEAWDNSEDIASVLQSRNMTQYYPVVSWYCLLAGYQRFPEATAPNKMPASQIEGLRKMLAARTELFIPV